MVVKLHALGESVIQIGDVRLGPDSEVLFALLTYLVVERGRPISRSELLALLWGQQDYQKGRHCLRQAIYKLRRLGVPLQTRPDGYLLESTAAAADFDTLSSGSWKPRCQPGIQDTYTLLRSLRNPTEAYGRWLEVIRERVGAQVRRALVTHLADARQRNDWEHSIAFATQCLVLDPLNEEATLTLAEASALQGNKKHAVDMLDAYIADMGREHTDIRLSASILRTRIAERVHYLPATGTYHSVFVGRDVSIQLLTRIAQEVATGSGHVCAITGEPGVGKTRLMTEVANLLAMTGYRIVRTSCRADASEQALSVLIALAPQLLRLPGALGCSPEALSLVKRLHAHNALDPLDSQYGNHHSLQEALRHAVRELLDSLAAERPLAVFIDDVQWCDAHSWSVLRELSASNRSRPLLIVLSSSHGGLDRLPTSDWDLRQVLVHHLHDLSDADSRRLVAALSSSVGIAPDEKLVEWCVAHGNGNPLFLTALVFHWRDTRDFTRVPPSLELLIQERLRVLSPEALRALQAASLLGDLTTHDRLLAILGLPRWQLFGVLDELDRAHFAASHADGIRVTHQLASLAALQQLTPLSHSVLHAAIARTLEYSVARNQDATCMWRAASHWSAAGDRPRALSLVTSCASHLVSVGLAMEGAEMLQQAREFCQSNEEHRAVLSLRVDALMRASALASVASVCQEILEIDARSAHATARQHSVDELALLRARVGLHAADVLTLDTALNCVRACNASLSHRFEAGMWGLAACYAGRKPDVARTIMTELWRLKPHTPADHRYLLSASLVYHADLGDTANGITTGDLLIALERAQNNSHTLIRALRVSAYAHRHAGNWATAESRIDESAELARTSNHTVYYAHAIVAKAQYFIDRKQLEQAWMLVSILDQLTQAHPYLAVPLIDTVSAEVALLREDPDSAARFIARVRKLDTTAARHEGDRLALVLAYELQLGHDPSVSDIDELMELHLLLRDSPGHDFSASTLFTALRMLGRRDTADQLARTYLSLRRETWEPWLPFLAE